jgi:peptidoglycan/xylan/chitin deacetylase (PgdA/CDA1 family)
MRCERYALGYFGEKLPGRSRILCFHSVGTPEWGVNDVSPDRFRQHLETALKAGYRFVPADLIAAEAGDEPRLAITFDDGLKSVATNAAPILKEMGIPWSLFVVTDWADGNHQFDPDSMLTWAEIDGLAAGGATIGSHSVTHPNFGRISEGEVEQELYESRLTVASRIGITPASFAIPLGQSKNWTAFADKAARRAGYLTVYAQSEALRHPSTVPRTFITRFDDVRIFKGALAGSFDRWEEWL